MTSSNFNGEGLVDFQWRGPAGELVLIEIKRTSNARDVREGLVWLAYALEELGQDATAVCVVVDSRLRPERLREELARFRRVIKPQYGRSVFLTSLDKERNFVGEVPASSERFRAAVLDTVQREADLAGGRVSRQQVMALLVERWLSRLPPITMAEAGRQSGASHPTIARAVSELRQKGLLQGGVDGRLDVEIPNAPALRRLAEEHAVSRKAVRFVDPSGQARPPLAMADRLEKLAQKGLSVDKVAVGGVLGAAHYWRQLNVTGAPRLDLSVYAGDASFVRKLDAGLVPVKHDEEGKPTVLMVHLQRDNRPSEGPTDQRIASRLDCLADLLEMGLQGEASEFASALIKEAKER